MSITPHLVTNAAVKGIANDIAERLGKSPSAIYAMGERPDKDRYSKFLQFWLVIADLNFQQADLLFRDFEAHRNALAPQRVAVTTEPRAMASVSEQISEVMKAHFERKSNDEKLRKIAEAQEALRRLSAAILRAESNSRGLQLHEQEI
jgi:hypothetical protein